MSSHNSEHNLDNRHDDQAELTKARWHGVKDGFSVPAMSLFFSMVGFSSIAREAGFDVVKSVTTSAVVWGMPGQVAAISLHMAGASLWVAFTAVALANMRMLLMTISGMDMLGLREFKMSFWKKLGLMQLLAITSWIQLGQVSELYPKRALLHYYITMALCVYGFGLLGTGIGYYVTDYLPRDVLVAVLVMTPMYILLMVINARQVIHRLAGVCGGILCPLAFPMIGEWGILLGGIVGGTIALWIKRKTSLVRSDNV